MWCLLYDSIAGVKDPAVHVTCEVSLQMAELSLEARGVARERALWAWKGVYSINEHEVSFPRLAWIDREKLVDADQ